MFVAQRKVIGGIFAAIVALQVSVSPSYSAQGTDVEDLIGEAVVTSDNGPIEVETRITFNSPLPSGEAVEVLRTDFGFGDDLHAEDQTVDDGRLELSTAAIEVEGPSGGSVEPMNDTPGRFLISYCRCDRTHYAQSDELIFTWQRACAGAAPVPWSLQIRPHIQAILEPTVNEYGLEWSQDGVPMSQNAQHMGYPRGYLFHGSMNTVMARSLIEHSDVIEARHIVAGGGEMIIIAEGRFIYAHSGPWES